AREGGPPFEVTLTRAVIEVTSVKSRVLEPGYGYLRISQFQNNSGSAAKKRLQKMLKKDPAMKGLVLDLRNNPGGVLQAAVEITDLFIDDGLIVYTEGRVKEVDTRYNSETPDLTNGLPIVVLVNGGSASASEIVAGALQDHQRALIVGTETFGKGSVQSVLPLSKEHAIKLTTALYYTPDGRSIQAQGIIPDIEIKPAKITPLKQSVVGVTEADLNKRLDNATGGEDHSYSKRLKKKGNQLSSKDNQLYDALNLLKGISLTIKKTPKTTTASTE
ncbi:MAG: S41 family peptidase, partial [Pseudomonadales bacterium]